ncbi:MAG: DUF1127 domain-containing protein [Pseudomonadota bacterium]
MESKANRPTASHALASAVLEALAYIAAPKRLLGTWTWKTDPTHSNRQRLLLGWKPDNSWEKRVLEELRRMSDRELADIGLSRSDLTLEGLAIAGTKRARRQDAIATEIAKSTRKRGADHHGN